MPFFHRRNMRILLLLAVGVFLLLFGYYLSSVFNPLLIAFIIAYILNPLVTAFERKGVPRTVTVVGIIFITMAVIVLTLLVAVPMIYGQVVQIPDALIGDEYYSTKELMVDWNNNGKFDPGDEYYSHDRLMIDLNNNGICDPDDKYYPEPELRIDKNGNGEYDYGDEYYEPNTLKIDRNGNGVYDPGDEYYPGVLAVDMDNEGDWDPGDKFYPHDQLMKDLDNDGICDPDDAYYPEPMLKVDWNGNGKFDEGDEFYSPDELMVDHNGNGIYDPGDEFYQTGILRIDRNGNGRFDPPDFYYPPKTLKTDLNGNGKYDPGYIEKGIALLEGWSDKLHIDKKLVDKDKMYDNIIEQMGGPKGIADKMPGVFTFVLSQVTNIFNLIILFALIPIYLFFLLREMNAIENVIIDHLPGMYRDRILDIWHQIHAAVAGFFRGRLIISIICIILILPVLMICEVPFNLVIAILAGVSMLVPYMWIPLGLIPACLLVWFEAPGEWWRIGVVAGWMIFVANLDQFVLTPKIVGKEVELHPVTILLSMFVFGSLFGFFGLLMAIPLMATAKILGKEFVLPELKALASEVKTKKDDLINDN